MFPCVSTEAQWNLNSPGDRALGAGPLANMSLVGTRTRRLALLGGAGTGHAKFHTQSPTKTEEALVGRPSPPQCLNIINTRALPWCLCWKSCWQTIGGTGCILNKRPVSSGERPHKSIRPEDNNTNTYVCDFLYC